MSYFFIYSKGNTFCILYILTWVQKDIFFSLFRNSKSASQYLLKGINMSICSTICAQNAQTPALQILLEDSP